jgi:hypothetical protein
VPVWAGTALVWSEYEKVCTIGYHLGVVSKQGYSEFTTVFKGWGTPILENHRILLFSARIEDIYLLQ